MYPRVLSATTTNNTVIITIIIIIILFVCIFLLFAFIIYMCPCILSSVIMISHHIQYLPSPKQTNRCKRNMNQPTNTNINTKTILHFHKCCCLASIWMLQRSPNPSANVPRFVAPEATKWNESWDLHVLHVASEGRISKRNDPSIHGPGTKHFWLFCLLMMFGGGCVVLKIQSGMAVEHLVNVFLFLS